MAVIDLINANPRLEEKDLLGFASLSNLDKFIGEGSGIGDMKYTAYKANIIKKIDVCVDKIDEEKAAFRELIGAGLTNVESFVNYARKNTHSLFIRKLDCVLTAYVNNLIKYVCEKKSSADSIVDEYEYLIKLANSNMSMRFTLNALNKYIEELCVLNKDNADCVIFDNDYIDSSLVYIAYRTSVTFTWAHLPLKLKLRDNKTLINDDNNIWTSIQAGSDTAEFISKVLDSLFVNRMIKVYAYNPKSVISVHSFYVFKTLTNGYNIVYV